MGRSSARRDERAEGGGKRLSSEGRCEVTPPTHVLDAPKRDGNPVQEGLHGPEGLHGATLAGEMTGPRLEGHGSRLGRGGEGEPRVKAQRRPHRESHDRTPDGAGQRGTALLGIEAAQRARLHGASPELPRVDRRDRDAGRRAVDEPPLVVGAGRRHRGDASVGRGRRGGGARVSRRRRGRRVAAVGGRGARVGRGRRGDARVGRRGDVGLDVGGAATEHEAEEGEDNQGSNDLLHDGNTLFRPTLVPIFCLRVLNPEVSQPCGWPSVASKNRPV